MAHAQATVMVDQEIDEVFAFLANGMNAPRWRPDVVQVVLASQTPPGVGSVWRQRMIGPGRRTIDGDYRIVEYHAPTLLSFEVIAGPARPNGSFSLRELDSKQTEVTFTLDLVPTGFLRFLTRAINRQMALEVTAIKNIPAAIADQITH